MTILPGGRPGLGRPHKVSIGYGDRDECVFAPPGPSALVGSRCVGHFELLARAGALGLIVMIFSYEVFSRYLMGAPTKWASDFVSFLLLISIFLVLPHVTRIDGNVSVPILLNVLGRRASDFMRRLGFVLGAAVCLWAGYIFLDETLRLIDRVRPRSPACGFPNGSCSPFSCSGW